MKRFLSGLVPKRKKHPVSVLPPLNLSKVPKAKPFQRQVITVTKSFSEEEKETFTMHFEWALETFESGVNNIGRVLQKAKKLHFDAKYIKVLEKLLKATRTLQDAVMTQYASWRMSPAWNGTGKMTRHKLPNWPIAPKKRYTVSIKNQKFYPVTWNENNSRSVFAPNVVKTMDNVGVVYMDALSKLAPRSSWAKVAYTRAKSNTSKRSQPLPSRPHKGNNNTTNTLPTVVTKPLSPSERNAVENVFALMKRKFDAAAQAVQSQEAKEHILMLRAALENQELQWKYSPAWEGQASAKLLNWPLNLRDKLHGRMQNNVLETMNRYVPVPLSEFGKTLVSNDPNLSKAAKNAEKYIGKLESSTVSNTAILREARAASNALGKQLLNAKISRTHQKFIAAEALHHHLDELLTYASFY